VNEATKLMHDGMEVTLYAEHGVDLFRSSQSHVIN